MNNNNIGQNFESKLIPKFWKNLENKKHKFPDMLTWTEAYRPQKSNIQYG